MLEILAGLLTLVELALAQPETLTISTKLYFDGKLHSNPTISVIAGEPAEVSQVDEDTKDGYRIKIIAGEKDEKITDHVLIRYEIERTLNSKKSRSQASVMAKLNGEATLSASPDGKEQFKLSVTPRKSQQ